MSEVEELQANPSTSSDDAESVDIALEAARAAAKVIRNATAGARKPRRESKARFDFVSEVDKTATENLGCRCSPVRRGTLLGEDCRRARAIGRRNGFHRRSIGRHDELSPGYPEYATSIGVARTAFSAQRWLNVARGEEFNRAKRGWRLTRRGKRIRVSNLREPRER